MVAKMVITFLIYRGNRMNRIKVTEEEKNKIYAALKLIEALYKNGKIPKHVFKNILEEKKNIIDLKDFQCYN